MTLSNSPGQATWSAVDALLERTVVQADPIFEEILAANREAGLPSIDVTAAQGKLLGLLVQMSGAKRVVEVGTLGGYSTTWMARALPRDGAITSLEFEPHHAEVARANLERAGVSERVQIIVGDARETLKELTTKKLGGPVDLAFIDADKKSSPIYVLEILRLAHPGTIIVVDNVVRGGRVADMKNYDPNLEGIRETFDLIGAEKHLEGTAIQTVGGKGYDGLLIARVQG